MIMFIAALLTYVFGDTISHFLVGSYGEEANPIMGWMFKKLGEFNAVIFFKYLSVVLMALIYLLCDMINLYALADLVLLPVVFVGLEVTMHNLGVYDEGKKMKNKTCPECGGYTGTVNSNGRLGEWCYACEKVVRFHDEKKIGTKKGSSKQRKLF